MRRRAAIAAPNSSATRAGLEVMAEGGNAVDAAVAATIAASVTEPGIIGPLGAAFINVWPADGEPTVVDGNVVMPGKNRPPERFGRELRRYESGYGGGITVWGGHGSVAVPGAIAGMGEAVERFGLLPWGEVVLPAARVLRAGYPVGPAAVYYLGYMHDSLFGWSPETRRAHHRPDGSMLVAGDVLTNIPGAEALEGLADRGWQDLYTGELAAALVAEMDAGGGLVSAADLAAYRAEIRRPIRLTLGDWEVAVNPPPSIGGPVLATLLRLQAERGTPTAADLIDHQAMVLRYRHDHLDHASDLVAAGAELVRLAEERGRAGLTRLPTSPDTIHVSAVDSDGNACALTSSAGYGSGLAIPGTGLLLNGCLGEPELNRQGLHALPIGARLASNMAPCTARAPGGSGPVGARLAVGSPGADRITSALYQVLTWFCLEGMDLQAANNHPRAHVHFRGEQLVVDHEDDADLAAGVRTTGHDARAHPRSMYFGGVGAALLDAQGELSASGDPRREAAVAVG